MVGIILQLPVHLQWNIIFDWLADWKYIGNVDSAACCRTLRSSFHHVLRSAVITMPIPVPSAGSEVVFVKWIVQRRLLVQSVQIGSFMAAEKSLQETFLAITGIHITTFRICGASHTSSDFALTWAALFLQIAAHCANLERLYLDNVDPAEVSVVFASCKKITHFRCRKIRETSLRSLLKYCPKLVSLEYAEMNPDCVGSYGVPMFSPLVHFAMIRVLISPHTRFSVYEIIKHCPLLEVFSTGYIASHELEALTRGCPHMVSFCTLNISRIYATYGTDTIAAIVQHWPSVCCLSFESINIDHFNVMSDANMLVLVGGCKNLHWLHIGGVHSVDWKEALLPRAPALVVHTPDSSALRILLVDKLEPDSLQAVLTCAPHLECFAMKLKHLPHGADRRTLELLTEYQVNRLCLGEGGSLTNDQCALLSGLHELRCRYSDQPNCVTFMALAKRCPELHTLAVQLSPNMLSQLHKILLNCPNLRTLTVTVAAQERYQPVSLVEKELLCGCFKLICPKLVHVDLPSK